LYDRRDEAKLNELANKFLATNERKDAGWLLAAMFCDLKEDTDRAKLLVDRVLQVSPSNICAHLFKGKLLLLNGHSDQALISFHQANILRKDVRSFALLISAQLAANKVKEATNSAKECLSVAPMAATSHILMGQCYARSSPSQSMGDSVKAFQKALHIDAKSIVAASSLAEAYMTQDKNSEAVSILKRTLDLNGKRSDSHRLRTQLARCYTRMENYASAIEELHLVIELDPDHGDAIAELERCEQLLSA
jgi:tetratricopeptide (TPR) repeat protein